LLLPLYGASYDPDAGRVNLYEQVEPGTKLYVEYYHDIPAAPGKGNIKVYLHGEI
jgi:hypothetical protein